MKPFKVGDRAKVIEGSSGGFTNLPKGNIVTITKCWIDESSWMVNTKECGNGWYADRFKKVAIKTKQVIL